MRYSSEPKYRKYVKDYGVLSFARKFGDKYGKKPMDIAIKTGIDLAKTVFKRVVQKTGDLTGNAIAYKISSVGKTKSKEKKEIYIPSEKRLKLLMT